MTPSLHNFLIVNDDNKESVKLMFWNTNKFREKPSFGGETTMREKGRKEEELLITQQSSQYVADLSSYKFKVKWRIESVKESFAVASRQTKHLRRNQCPHRVIYLTLASTK